MDFVTTVWGAVVWVWEFMIDPEYRWWKIAFLAGMVVSAVSKEFFDGILKAVFYTLIAVTCIVVLLALT